MALPARPNVWMRDGWEGLNVLTSGAPVLPDAAVDIFGFSAGQATFDASIDVAPVTENGGQARGGPGSAGPRPRREAERE